MTTLLNFDASQVEPQVPFETVPGGDYLVCLVADQAKPTKANDGGYLNADFIIQEGQYKGRHLFEVFNLWNKSQEAKKIAERQFSGLCHAVGVLYVPTTDVLYNIPVIATVAVEQDAQYGPQNRIRGFKKAGGQPAPFASAPTTSPGDANPPWRPDGQPPANPNPAWAAEQPQATPPATPAAAAPPWAANAPAASSQPPWANK